MWATKRRRLYGSGAGWSTRRPHLLAWSAWCSEEARGGARTLRDREPEEEDAFELARGARAVISSLSTLPVVPDGSAIAVASS
jgi:hypothetical protein